MKETQKFRLGNGNEVTVSEMDTDAIMLTLEEVEQDSMTLMLRRNEAWAIGRAMMHLGYVANKGREDE